MPAQPTAGPAGPDTDNPQYRWNVLIVVMIGTMMAALDSSIVNISLPDMMAAFGVGVDDIEWVATGYMLAYAVFIPMAAWFKDRLGHRNLYLAALAIFTLGSLLCGLAWNLPSLIAARVLQALGGGFLTPIGMSMVSEVFPPKERGRALGLWGVGVIAGPALGPTLGGYLTKNVGWRSIFLVNIPSGVVLVLMGLVLVKRDRPHPSARKPFDTWGFLFLATFLVSFLLGLSKGEREGWTSSFIITCWILSALGLGGFLVVEAGEPYGIVDLGLFKSNVFTACVLVTVGRTIALFASIFLLPLFMQNLMGLDELQSGLMLLPGSLVLAACMPVAGRLSDRMGPRWLALAGSLCIAFFMFQYRLLDADSSRLAVVLPTLIRGVGIALIVAPVMATALNAVPTAKASQASSVLNLTQQISGSIGIALLATYLDHRRRFHYAELSQRMGLAAGGQAPRVQALAEKALGLGLNHGQARLAALGEMLRTVGRAAAVRGFDDAFLFGACIILASCLPVFLLPKHNIARHRGPSDEPVVLE